MVEITSPLYPKYLERRNKKEKRKERTKKILKSAGRITGLTVLLSALGVGGYAGYNYVSNTNETIGDLERKINKIVSESDKIAGLPTSYLPDGKYDFDTRLISDFNQLLNISNATYKIETEAVYVNDDGIEVTRRGYGSGILLNNKKVITAAHVLEADKTFHSILTGYNGKLKESHFYLIHKGERFELINIMKRMDERDIGTARLEEKDIDFTYFDGDIGEYRDLRRGNLLYAVGYGAGSDEARLRDGIFSSIYEKDISFTYSGGVNGGDSGCPVFAVMDGELELVGIVTRKIYMGFEGADDYGIIDIVSPNYK